MSDAMTKKDYELIAGTIFGTLFTTTDLNDPERFLADDVDEDTARDIVNELASAFSRDNPRFDRKRFLEACGLEVM